VTQAATIDCFSSSVTSVGTTTAEVLESASFSVDGPT
jgi:hypothetical protein